MSRARSEPSRKECAVAYSTGATDLESTQVSERLSTPTVAVRYPYGQTEYWVTDRKFAEGDTLPCNGRAWLVKRVRTAAETGDKLLVELGEVDNAA
jgi:hypothetical protein